MDKPDIYHMKLHETLSLDNRVGHTIMRVPGGWLYKYFDQIVFVPYNNEFEEPDSNKIFQFRKEN